MVWRTGHQQQFTHVHSQRLQPWLCAELAFLLFYWALEFAGFDSLVDEAVVLEEKWKHGGGHGGQGGATGAGDLRSLWKMGRVVCGPTIVGGQLWRSLEARGCEEGLW